MGSNLQIFTMKLLIFAFFAIFTIVNCSSEQEWQNFKLKFEKGFKSIGHETERKVIFMENLREIESHNAKFEAGLTTYKKGINYYSDWTWEEFKDVVLMKEQVSRRNVHHPKRGSEEKIAGNFETSKDWRSVMNPVKNQGHCGSCWAFGAIGAVEAAWYLAGNDKIVLSEQMLVDCGPGAGCDGGWVDYALDYLIDSGAETEADYPYTAGEDEEAGTCKLDNTAIAATISDYDTVLIYYEGTDALAQSINDHGPHATHLYANDNFKQYASGIFDDVTCPTSRANHAVINVGYDTVEGYWLIRNSWGPTWGDGGHIKMAMGKNTCNVESDAWLPKV